MYRSSLHEGVSRGRLPRASFVTFCGWMLFANMLLGQEAQPSEPAAEGPSSAVETADRELHRAAQERDQETFHELLALDATFLAGELHQGRLAVLALWQPLFDAKYGFRYEGEPLEVQVAESGELAWSLGNAKTRFQRPGLEQVETTEGHYLHVWGLEGDAWLLKYMTTLVVHPSLGQARDPRSGLMTAWPELANRIGDRIEITWDPIEHVVADSGEMAFTFGEYSATFGETEEPEGEKSESEESEAEEPESEESTPSDEKETREEAPEGASEVESSDAVTEESEKPISGSGHYLAIWQRDDAGRWQLAAEGFTPPGIYGES